MIRCLAREASRLRLLDEIDLVAANMKAFERRAPRARRRLRF